MPNFTNAEYADIVMAYGKADGVARAGQRIYQAKFPDRRLPHHETFSTTYRRLRETGNLNFQEPRVNVRQHHVAVDDQILQAFEEDPTTSIRVVAQRLNLTIWKVWSVLQDKNQHAFLYTPVQGLHEGDPARRLEFCRFLLHTDVDDNLFLKRILWTDESCFNREGITNLHNLHHWAPKDENPHVKRQMSFQQKFSVNVWAGVIGRHLIGPHYLPARLSGPAYLHFLQNALPELLADVPAFDEDVPIVFQHDGCPAHFLREVRDHLDNSFPNSWIGRAGPIPWPARSPDLTPLDYHVWGRAKELVYFTEVPTREVLIERINAAFVVMKEEMLLATTTVEIRKRCRACIRSRGEQFEQNLR